ncbi:MAG TPA: lysophospholipid acyltransferase family protein [Thermoanaerobaculia bacterium]|nr:lysophospholipid acyltransferase family protein [Thermoanaerobaculia bacterium]
MDGAGAAAAVVGAGILGLRASFRIREIHPEREASLKQKGVPYVYTLWHGRMVLCILAHLHEEIVTMASRSKDGEVIARWLIRNGYIPVRGSTRKGGRAALQEMIDLVRAGHRAALTVDGPKGPPRKTQPGVLKLARETGSWILPFTGASSRPWFLESWDRYLVPKPFSRCVVGYGEPFPIPPDMPDEVALAKIDAAVDEITMEVDREMGVVPPPPWKRSGEDGGE